MATTNVVLQFPAQEGEELLAALDKTEFKVEFAYWHRDSDGERDWQMVLASPFVQQKGMRQAYLILYDVLKEIGAEWLRSEMIYPVGMDFAPLPKIMERSQLALGSGFPKRTWARLPEGGGSTSEEEIYIYRLPKVAEPVAA